MENLLVLMAMLTVVLIAAVPVIAQEIAVNPDTAVSSGPTDGGTFDPSECERLAATGAEIYCYPQDGEYYFLPSCDWYWSWWYGWERWCWSPYYGWYTSY